ncbi:MAG: radical SAM protein [Pseudomonadota bacterium]
MLFCIVPSITLWRTHPYIEPSYAPSLVVGGLERRGFNVRYVDLNLLMNSWQREAPQLSRDTTEFLHDWPETLLTTENCPSDLDVVLTRMTSYLSDARPNYLAFSIDRITTIYEIFHAQFGFAIALSRRLRELHRVPVVWGGQIVRRIGYGAIRSHLQKTPEPYVDFLFFGDGALSLPLLLSALETDDRTFSALRAHLNRTREPVVWIPSPRTWVDLEEPTSHESPPAEDPASRFQEFELLQIQPSFRAANRQLYLTSLGRLFPTVRTGAWGEQPIALYPYKFMYGCSHKCAFCKSANQSLVVRPVREVVDDLQRLVEEQGIDCFRFFNAQINYSAQYVREFCREIIRRRLKVCFSDSASLRNLDQELCSLLREAGCVKLWFGVESPVERILGLIHKEMASADARSALRTAHDAGIWVGVNIIVGFPHETDSEFAEVCRFVEEQKEIADCWQFSALEVHKNTPMADRPADYGIELHHPYTQADPLYGYAFSEIGGLNWKERELRAVEREGVLGKLVNPKVHRFHLNDYLVFALYREYGDKSVVRRELTRYVNEIKDRIGLGTASRWLTPKRVFDEDLPDLIQRTLNSERPRESGNAS